MDAIKSTVSAMTTRKEVDAYLQQITAICREKKADLRAKEKEIATKAKAEKIARAKAILASVTSGTTIKVTINASPTDAEFLTTEDDKFVVKFDGKKRKLSYNQLVVS